LSVPYATELKIAKQLQEQLKNAEDPGRIRSILLSVSDEEFARLLYEEIIPSRLISGHSCLDNQVSILVHKMIEQVRQERINSSSSSTSTKDNTSTPNYTIVDQDRTDTPDKTILTWSAVVSGQITKRGLRQVFWKLYDEAIFEHHGDKAMHVFISLYASHEDFASSRKNSIARLSKLGEDSQLEIKIWIKSGE